MKAAMCYTLLDDADKLKQAELAHPIAAKHGADLVWEFEFRDLDRDHKERAILDKLAGDCFNAILAPGRDKLPARFVSFLGAHQITIIEYGSLPGKPLRPKRTIVRSKGPQAFLTPEQLKEREDARELERLQKEEARRLWRKKAIAMGLIKVPKPEELIVQDLNQLEPWRQRLREIGKHLPD